MFWEQNLGGAKSSYSPVHVFEHLQVLWLRTGRSLSSYSNRFPTFFSFFSGSLNHPLSMHSVHFLLNLELDKSRIIEFIWGASITTLNGSIHRCSLCLTGTQNSGSSSWPIHHALLHKVISMSALPVLSCEIPDSQTKVRGIVCQHCSILYKHHVLFCLTQNLSV